MIEKKLPDGRIARFPAGTHDLIIQKTMDKLTANDEKTKKQEEDKKSEKAEQARKENLDETRHKEKIAVGLQGVKASLDRNKASSDHVKATKDIAPQISKSLDGNAAKIASELSAIRKSLDGFKDMGKQLQELSTCIDELGSKIEQGIKLVVSNMNKPKKITRSERGALTGIQSED